MEEIGEIIKKRLADFETLGKTGIAYFDFSPFANLEFKATLQSEFAFCISTANSSAISGLKFQKTLENLNPEELSVADFETLLRSSNVRFHRKKAIFIKEGLNKFNTILDCLYSPEPRKNLVKNVRGFGLKEASHFLRNIGWRDFAIIDRHIIRCLVEREDTVEPSCITPAVYSDCEFALKKIARHKDMTLSELDLWLWYEKTGKVLK